MALTYLVTDLKVETVSINETESTKCDNLVEMFTGLVLTEHS